MNTAVQAQVKMLLCQKSSLALVLAFAFFFCLSWTFPGYADGQSLARCLVGATLFTLPVAALTLCAVAAVRLIGCAPRRLPHAIALPVRLRPWHAFVFSLITFLVIWGICLAVLYPGILSTDSIDVIRESLGIYEYENHFRYNGANNHHPYVYVLATGALFRLGLALGFGERLCVALIALAHLVVLALCCSFVISRIWELSASPLLLVLSWMFVAFNPVLAQYSVTLWKDIPFSAFLIVFAIEIASMCYRGGSDLRSRPKQRRSVKDKHKLQHFRVLGLSRADLVLFVLSGMLCALLRSNGLLVVFASLVAVPALLPSARTRVFAGLAVVTIAVPLFVGGPIYSVLGIQAAHFSEALSIPLQQVGRTVSEGRSLTSEQSELLEQILPLEEWSSLYREGSPNPIKFSEDFDDEFLDAHKVEFIITWVQVGLQNPDSYVRAWTAQTASFWNIAESTWYTESAGYNAALDQGHSSLVARNHFAGLVDEVDIKYAETLAISIFEPFFNIGALAWGMLFSLLYLAVTRQYDKTVCIVPALAVWACFLLAAPGNDFRYMLTLHLYVPLLALLLFCPKSKGTGSACGNGPLETQGEFA